MSACKVVFALFPFAWGIFLATRCSAVLNMFDATADMSFRGYAALPLAPRPGHGRLHPAFTEHVSAKCGRDCCFKTSCTLHSSCPAQGKDSRARSIISQFFAHPLRSLNDNFYSTLYGHVRSTAQTRPPASDMRVRPAGRGRAHRTIYKNFVGPLRGRAGWGKT